MIHDKPKKNPSMHPDDIFLSLTNFCLPFQSLNLLHLLVKIMKIDVFEKLFSFAVFFKLNQKNLNKTRAKRAPDIWARKFKYSETSENLNFRAKMSVSAIFKHSVSFKVCKKVSQTRKGFLLHFKSFCMDFKGVKGEERTQKKS